VCVKKYISVLCILLAIFLFAYSIFFKPEETEKKNPEAPKAVSGDGRAGICAAFEKNISDMGITASDIQAVSLTPEERVTGVYTFLQGPKSYGEGRTWSGSWCEKTAGYHSFGGFGCGLCCMANIYSTLTDYECSPWDMYEFATAVSSYYPSKESGAIGWEDMRTTLSAAGFACKLRRKPKTYAAFRRQIRKAESAVVLISSANDDSFWKDTPGHYVNIWRYREDTDEVFLAEPGDPERNRTFVPLRFVYDALKTVSQFQYLTVTSYSEEGNIWKKNGIEEDWNGKFFGIN